ncbi:MAG: hypothetical protein NT094_04230 [Candidatus Staskawiczbacteria bacterium]|nr:hypothetical protein [Candidatus Staskawiczbacteria bacterium]
MFGEKDETPIPDSSVPEKGNEVLRCFEEFKALSAKPQRYKYLTLQEDGQEVLYKKSEEAKSDKARIGEILGMYGNEPVFIEYIDKLNKREELMRSIESLQEQLKSLE